MINSEWEFEHFSSKEGFNKSLGHFQAVCSLLDDFQDFINLADILNELLEDKEITQNQLSPIVYALLSDKYEYCSESFNQPVSLSDFLNLYDDIKGWKAVDIVISYFHPELGLILINPKNKSHWDSLNTINKNEMLTIYAGCFDKSSDNKLYTTAIKRIIDLFSGKKGKTPDLLKKGSLNSKKTIIQKTAPDKTKAPAKKEKQPVSTEKTVNTKSEKKPSSNKRMTPFYSIPVTNELFHNGNVEAWKKIIQSYNQKNPDIDVYIFYDGEKINDINTLFKWGKVKHGSTILFAVSGNNIKDVAKLQRYLYQGASPRFEDFLRFPVNKILNLF